MINLNEHSLSLLTSCLSKHAPELLPVIRKQETNDFTVEFYNHLREIVGDEFISKGLIADDSPNEYGLSLESLIDEIGRLFM